MSQYKQHILLSYFKTLSVSSVWDLNPLPSSLQSRALQHELHVDKLKIPKNLCFVWLKFNIPSFARYKRFYKMVDPLLKLVKLIPF